MTKYIKEKDINKDTIIEISNAMRQGKIVVFKTDTVYGIGTNAFNEEACKKIYEIKRRPSNKPLSLLITNLDMLKEIVDQINPAEQKLINAFWPGALTIKFKKKEKSLPDIVSAKDDYVRVRLLKTEPAYSLIQTAGVPIVAPSANLSGSPTGIEIDHILNELDGKVDYIIDSGNLIDSTTSTIVEVVEEKVMIIREGKIKREVIEKVVPCKN